MFNQNNINVKKDILKYDQKKKSYFSENSGVGNLIIDTKIFIGVKIIRVFNQNDVGKVIIIQNDIALEIISIINEITVIVETPETLEESIYNTQFLLYENLKLFNLRRDSLTDVSNKSYSIISFVNSNFCANENSMNDNNSYNYDIITPEINNTTVKSFENIFADDINLDSDCMVRAVDISTSSRSNCSKEGIAINQGFNFPLYVYSNTNNQLKPTIYSRYSFQINFKTPELYNYSINYISVTKDIVKLIGKEENFISKFHFNENLRDSIGGIEGRFMCGDGTFLSGKIENCVELNGKNFIYLNDDKFISNRGSVGGWFKLRHTDGIQGLIRNGIIADNSGYGLLIIDGSLLCCWENEMFDAEYMIEENTWYHIVVSWTETKIKLHINGEKIFKHELIDKISKNVIILGASRGVTNYKENMSGWVDEFFTNNINIKTKDIKFIYQEEQKGKRMKVRNINTFETISSKYPIHLKNFRSIEKCELECIKPENTFIDIKFKYRKNLNQWETLNLSADDIDFNNIYMQFRLKTVDERKTPKIKSFTFVSSLEHEDGFPIEFQNSKNDLYLGFIKKFDSIRIVLDRHNTINCEKSLNLYYWCGTSWKTLKVLDNTQCLNVSGNISFQIPSDWVEKCHTPQHSAEELFYVKLIFINALNAPLSLNEINLGIMDADRDFYINDDCSVHLPRITATDTKNINSVYRSQPNTVTFLGNDGMSRNLSSVNTYSIERLDRNINISIISMLGLHPEKIEEGFSINLKNLSSNKFYLCTVIDKKWRYIEYK